MPLSFFIVFTALTCGALALGVYLFWLHPLVTTRRLRTVGAVLVFLVSIKYLVYAVTGFERINSGLPWALTFIYEALYGALTLMFVVGFVKVLLFWVITVALKCRVGLLRTLRLVRSGMISLRFFLTVLALCVGAGLWGGWQAVRVPDVKLVSIYVRNLPASLEGFSVVQLTDLHVSVLTDADWLRQVVRRTMEQNADAIVLTGDQQDGSVLRAGPAMRAIAGLKAPAGVYVVSGNHEYMYDYAQWRTFYQRSGLTVLDNTHRTITRADGRVTFAGVTDISASRHGLSGPDREEALRANTADLTILLDHQPRAASLNTGVDLQLSGHTHGGMFLFMKPLVALMNGGFVSGLYDLGTHGQLYVSNGTGLWNGFAQRLGVPSEITKIVFHRK